MEALADDPDELESQLAALAGPSAGPNGGQFYVDGFTVEQQLPTKNSIREIRVNQNPFSAQYDKLGYGRVDFYQAGDERTPWPIHGLTATIWLSIRAILSPSKNQDTTHSCSPPMWAVRSTKKPHSFLDFQHRNVNLNEIVNGVILDSNFNQVPSHQTFSNPGSDRCSLRASTTS